MLIKVKKSCENKQMKGQLFLFHAINIVTHTIIIFLLMENLI